MGSVEPFDSMLVLFDQLRGHVQALQRAVDQDAEAEVIDGAVSRCAETFVLLKDFLSSLPAGWGHHEEARIDFVQALVAELCKTYEACIRTLASASARTAEKLARMQKTQSASQQYQRIAKLV
ncbi:hypothetical protein [Desulfosoma sp.]